MHLPLLVDPPSRVEILLMDMVKSQAESSKTLGALALGQRELAQSTEEKLSALSKGKQDLNLGQQHLIYAHSELAYAQIGQVSGLAELAGRITSIESSIHGCRNPSPFQDYRVSSPMVDTRNVSAPSTSSALVETSQPAIT